MQPKLLARSSKSHIDCINGKKAPTFVECFINWKNIYITVRTNFSRPQDFDVLHLKINWYCLKSLCMFFIMRSLVIHKKAAKIQRILDKLVQQFKSLLELERDSLTSSSSFGKDVLTRNSTLPKKKDHALNWTFCITLWIERLCYQKDLLVIFRISKYSYKVSCSQYSAHSNGGFIA